MTTVYEYRIIPAPARAEKHRGLKTTADRFAQTLADTLNVMGRDGWDYVRAESLPCEERTGFTGRTTNYHTLLVFRRVQQVPDRDAAPAPRSQPEFTAAPRLTLSDDGAAPRLGPATE